ncbi:hypothetical protein [Dyadobacter sandarakinus]|uniref:Glycosyltransferase RgtA/B/C/D-like domain-containing protein n=1 Tax=Dyadobacter sandarakinus TaxID=2747268 RepID=A0ABX7I8J7_9BACT|nr:hypothetical protein [Dyadobacter sandarakinus]QRR01867.1 hypothetical protein HWI92_13580 [Dyadobacter sandarakinus]
MLSFFRVNARYQTISLAVLFLLLRLPFFMGDVPMLIPELSWMLVGEQMGRGFTLYRDIWDNVSPFSGLTYWLIDSLFGRSPWVYQLAALLVSLIQILYFNYVIHSREVFPERTFVPGALYALFLNISFDLGTLSPMLLANTFLLFAFGSIVKILVRREVTSHVFEMGLYIGIATLFYLPASVFMVWAFLALIFYTGSTVRDHLLGLFGSVFPLLMVVLFFYMNNGIESLNRNLLTSVFQVKQYNLNDFSSLLASLLLPLGFGIMGFMRIFTTLRFVNYQTRIQQVMALWSIAAIFTIPLMQFLAPMQFVIFIPPAAFFATHYFQSFKRNSIADELQFTLMGALIILIQYQGLRGLLPGVSMGKLENLRAKPASLPDEIRGKRILVLGQHSGEYMNNFTATPYLNWELASYDLQNLDNFDSVIHVYDNFRKDPPEYVIDKVNIMPKLLSRVPALKQRYEQSYWKGIYQRKD